MSESFTAGLDRLRERFLARAAGERQTLEAAAAELARGADPVLHRGEIGRIAHGLAGAAGTLGFSSIGAQARRLEDGVADGLEPAALAEACRAVAVAIAAAQSGSVADFGAGSERRVAAPSSRTICIVDRADGDGTLRAMITSLGYDTVLVTTPEAPSVAGRPGAVAAFIITDAIEDALAAADRVSRLAPVLLVAQDRSFDRRLAAARAGVTAILSRPIDIGELADWLETFAEAGREPQLSVLIIDDDRIVAEAHAQALASAGIKATIINDPQIALEQVTATYPDLILMDMQMPGVGGLELARVIRQSRRHLSLPIVFLSSERDPGIQLEARQIGGDDFIVKPVDAQRLISVVRMRAERAVTLRSMMDRDSLTGLLNHARFKDRLALELQRCRRTGASISVVMIDLDRFKHVNDTYGHISGDRVIRALAHALTAGLRRTDVVGRYGGEEFAAILLDTTPEPALATIEKIRTSFGAIDFDGGGGSVFAMTFSAGIAGGGGASGPDQLIAAADRALYEAKAAGRNRTVLA